MIVKLELYAGQHREPTKDDTAPQIDALERVLQGKPKKANDDLYLIDVHGIMVAIWKQLPPILKSDVFDENEVEIGAREKHLEESQKDMFEDVWYLLSCAKDSLLPGQYEKLLKKYQELAKEIKL